MGSDWNDRYTPDVEKRCKEFKVKADVVVRCKECVFYNTERKGLTDEHICRRFSCLGVFSNYTSPDDFCSYGERKEGDEG
jgi:hypothetical protein